MLSGFFSDWSCWLAFSSFAAGRACLRLARIRVSVPIPMQLAISYALPWGRADLLLTNHYPDGKSKMYREFFPVGAFTFLIGFL